MGVCGGLTSPLSLNIVFSMVIKHKFSGFEFWAMDGFTPKEGGGPPLDRDLGAPCTKK